MFKKFLIAIVVVFVAIEVMDFLLHGLILKSLYMSTPSLWRSVQDMGRFMWVLYVVTFLQSIGFVYIYYKLIGNKSPFRGLWYGLTFGFTVGVGMGYATYAMLPMPYSLALGWFLGSIVIFGIAGWLTGLIITEKKA
jgi:hypothetical protein